jgi:uncharacterized cofD-like protein
MAKILIADNDELVIKQIKEALRRFGHTFVTTQDGKTAKQRLKREIFDLALIENNLPPIKGFDLANEQKALKVEDRVPIVLMASQHEAEDMRRAKEVGALDFITKPFNSRELVGKVLAILKEETRIVSLGGGTGLYTLLMGLKTLSRVHLVSVVAMSDDGGSTGRLREVFGVLPPGDVRRSLVALSTAPDLMNHLLSFRFKKGEELAGHNFGNLFLTALSEVSGTMQEAVRAASEILNVKGVVLPVTNTLNQLIAETEDGNKIYGENSIDVPKHRDFKLHIEKLWQEPPAYAIPEAISVIHNSEFITLGPGDLFTSLLPNLVVKGVPEAIRESEAKKIYICNLMTKPGETYGMTGEDHVEQVIKYLGGDFLDYIIFSKSPIPKKVISQYKKMHQAPVRLGDKHKMKKLTKAKVIMADITSTEDRVRHDSYKLAKVINDIMITEKRPRAHKAAKNNGKKSRKKR